MIRTRISNFLKKYGHIWTLSYAFLYLPWFLHLEETVGKGGSRYHIMHSQLDDLIPFNEYFIIPYLLWFVYVAGTLAYFFFVSKENYYRLCTYLFAGMTISLLICSVFPNGTDFRPMVDPDKNIFSAMVAALYRTDTCTNVFPSIHVYNSICTHVAIMKAESLKDRRLIRTASFVMMVSICLATVFLKQHSVIDVAGGILAAIVIYPLAYSGEYAVEKRTGKVAIR